MSAIPVDVLLEILGHVRKADLATLCRVNKIFCSYSQDVLYRKIEYGDERVIQTLAQSTDLARRVRSSRTYHDYPGLATALRNMSLLRRLSLDRIGDASILDGCTFKLDSFEITFLNSESLRKFLNSQPSITDLTIWRDCEPLPPFDERCLPNLTRVRATPSCLGILIPGRPVKEVSVSSSPSIDSTDLSFFTLSAAPIQKLYIRYDMVYPKPVSLLVSIFPSLVHLEVSTYHATWIEHTAPDVDEHIVNLLAALVHLRIFEFRFSESFSFKLGCPFIMKVSNRVPHLEYLYMPRHEQYYKRIGGKLVICDQTEAFRYLMKDITPFLHP